MNPAAQPAAEAPAQPDNSILKTDVVNNIPIHSQAAPTGGDDPELDKIMQDVGHNVEKNVQRPKKHHFFSKKDNPPVKKSEAKLSAQPLDRVTNAPAPIHDVQPSAATMPEQTPPAQAPLSHQQAPLPAQAQPVKPKTHHSVPIFMILVTVIITSALVIAAMAAYKQK